MHRTSTFKMFVLMVAISVTLLILSYTAYFASVSASRKQNQDFYLSSIAEVSTIKKARVLCWIMCDPDDLDKRVIHVRDTWAKRCDVTLFMSSQKNDTFPTVGLNVPAGRQHIGRKSRAAWSYLYKHHFNDADFFYKADPDTYVIVENLREYLSHRNASKPEYYGHEFISPLRPGYIYMSGGPGLAMTRESLRRLVTKAFQFEVNCMRDGVGEDWKTCYCLERVGAYAVNTSDETTGRERFMVWRPEQMNSGLFGDWYRKWDINGAREGMPECCHDYPISFHYIEPQEMHALDYLFYRAKHQ